MHRACMDLIWEQVNLLRADREVDTRPECEHICRHCGYDEKKFNEDYIPTCVNCGAVDVEFMSDEPEWRSGVDEDGHANDPSRVGMPADTTLFSEAWGTGTKMTLGKFATSDVRKIAKINFHTSMNHRDRALFHAYEDLERVGRVILDLPAMIVRDAKILYRKFNSEKLTRGAVRVGVKANCIIWACKQSNVPRTTKEVADAFCIPTRDISRTEDIFREAVEEEKNTNNGQITYPSDILGRFFNNLTVVPETEKGRVKMKMISMCKTIQKSGKLMGKTPKGTASAVMFVILGELGYKVEKQTICALCEVSLPTLNKLEPIVRTEFKKIVV